MSRPTLSRSTRLLDRLRWLALFAALLAIAVPASLAPASGGDDDDDEDDDDGPPPAFLKVGSCVRDITPITPDLQDEYEDAFGVPGEVNHTDPVYMAGFGNGRAATGYNDRLWARGVVVERAGTSVALVELDLIGYFLSEVETIRALVSPASGVDYVMVASSHQHEGPDTLGLWGPDQTTSGVDFAYLEFVNLAVADCIDEAAANLRKAQLYLAETSSEGLSLGIDPEDDGFGVADSRVLEGDDLLAPETDGRILDPRLGALQFTTLHPPHETIATLVNFASHPESLGSGNKLITSDFPNYVRERIEAEYGGNAIWFSGDLGVLQGPLDIDVEDPATGMPAQRRTFRWAEVHGTQVAERVIEAVDAARFYEFSLFGKTFRLPRPGDPFADVSFSAVSPVAIPLANPYFRFFIAIDVINPNRSLFTNGVPDDSIEILDTPFGPVPLAAGEDIQSEVAAVRIGDAGIGLLPDELDPQIGEGYRDALEAKGATQTFLFGLANDELGYQLPAEKFDPSCFECFLFVLGDVEELCPVQPVDCNTVFQNNVGPEMDPRISQGFADALAGLP